MSKRKRLHAATRLSIMTDESTSIERQMTGIGQWAVLKRNITGDTYEVVSTSEDTDVSGAISPFDRAGLGEYLREPLLSTWDILVVYRLDRLTRSIVDFEKIYKFLEAHGKTLVSVAEDIDFSSPAGRLMGRELVMFAEYEREMISARVKNAYDTGQRKGKYQGRQFPFGYIPVKLPEPEKGWGLDRHPLYGLVIVPEIAERLIAGEQLTDVCEWLESEQIPTPRNVVRAHWGKKPLTDSHWDTTALAGIFRSPAILGEVTVTSNGKDENGKYIRLKKAKALRDEHGMPIKRADPLISRETWENINVILDKNAARMGPKTHRSLLLGVAYCGQCQGALHSNPAKASKGGRTYRYYVCESYRQHRGCTAGRVDVEELNAEVTKQLMAKLGHLPLKETIEIAGSDYSTQMAEIAEAVGALTSQIVLGREHGRNVTNLEKERNIHEKNLADLADKPTVQPHSYERETNETWKQRWERLDDYGRNELMRTHKIKVWTYSHEIRIEFGTYAEHPLVVGR